MPHLHTRLEAARRRLFVGREAERDLFCRTLRGEPGAPQVYLVHGLGGVGKSSLLGEMARLAHENGLHPVWLDCTEVKPDPEGVLGALIEGLRRATLAAQTGADSQPGRAATAPQLSAVAGDPALGAALAALTGRLALFIDTYELLAPLDRWVRTVLLPGLPENCVVVLAGRNAPDWAWRSDPGWQTLVTILPLRNLNPEQSRQLLAARHIDPGQYAAVLDFTHGHPLALSLVADLFAQVPGLQFEPEAAPDIIKALMDHLIREVPGPLYRSALECCALVRWLNRDLLRELLNEGPSPAGPPPAGPAPETEETAFVPETKLDKVFEWLRTLSFLQAGPRGLHPHDVAREVLAAELSWRDPAAEARLRSRAHRYYEERLRVTQGAEQQFVLSDYMFLHRHISLVRPYMEWDEGPRLTLGAATAAEMPALEAMLERHEGAAAATLLRALYAAQPSGVLALRAGGQPAGMLALVSLTAANVEHDWEDAALNGICTQLRGITALRPTEKASVIRFWLARDTYQAVSPAQSQLFANMMLHYIYTPGLAKSYFCCADPDFWLPLAQYTDMMRAPELDYLCEGRRHGIYALDWRAMPPARWLALLSSREGSEGTATLAAPAPTERLVTLSEAEFATAVRGALRDLREPAGPATRKSLDQNPLLRSRVVAEHSGAGPDPASRQRVLRDLLFEACATLQQTPRQARYARALEAAYLKPAPTLEAAAERLDLPFSTFRRHVKTALELVTAQLWQREIGP